MQLSCQMSSLRADDHSTIGAVLGGLLTPAIFWKRAKTIHCMCTFLISFPPVSKGCSLVLLGGVGVGAGLGLVAHWVRNVAEEPLPAGPISKPPKQKHASP